jgi:hypothetical protein
MASLADSFLDLADSNGDIMAGFSSRGANRAVPDVIVPSVAAPGVDILAAYGVNDAVEWNFISGTSMASPHAAGSAALIMDVHPDWSPAEIQSAMMTSSIQAVTNDDGTTADPFDMGSGRVDLTQAARTGLLFDITYQEYVDANPGIGGNPAEINLASLGDADCGGTCSWTRVVNNPLDVAVTWNAHVTAPVTMTVTVSPETFTIGAGMTQTLTIDVDVNGLPYDEWVFGELVLTPNQFVYLPLMNTGGGAQRSGYAPTGGDAAPGVTPPDVHVPIAVVPTIPPPIIDVDPTSMSSTQDTDMVTMQTLSIGNTGGSDLTWNIFEDTVQSPFNFVDWSDDFDSYATDLDLHGVGGWKGWDNTPGATGYTRDEQALSAPNSVEISAPSDLVHEYAGYTTGFWIYTAWQYIPSDFSGQTYFIMLNTYSDGGTKNWSTQVIFDSGTGTVANSDGLSGGSTAMITGQWVEIRVEIDLVNNKQDFYYNNTLLYSGTWSEEVSGGGALNIGAIDLYGNGATNVYYDDISLVETVPDACDLTNDIPWASVSPDNGTTAAGGSDDVDVTFDSTGMGAGTYNASLCVASNDPANPLIQVPIDLIVNP